MWLWILIRTPGRRRFALVFLESDLGHDAIMALFWRKYKGR
jgi:hypothetical protein